MLIRIENEKQEIDYGSNIEEFHQIFGGKKGYWDHRYSDTPWAYETRELLINIAQEERKVGKPGTFGDLAENICISPTQISKAARGLLSAKPTLDYNGESPRDFVLHKLEDHYQKNYCKGPEYYI